MKKLISLVIILTCFGSFHVKAQGINEQEKFSMHGYMDMVYLGAEVKALDRNIGYLSMYRLNLMPQYTLSPKLKVTILLEGADLFRLDEAGDTDKPGIVEWSYLTYTHNAHFNVRVGTFAVPFGIYNERFYASPTQLTSFLPSSLYFRHSYMDEADKPYSTFLFPRSPSGLMLFGKILNSNKHYLSYFGYYANEAAGSSLIGINKYLGGRLLYENSNDKIKIGASYNSYIGANKLINSTVGADIELKIKNFVLSSEVIAAQIGKRDTNSFPIDNQFYSSRGGYIQAGYTIKETYTPYFRYDFFDPTNQLSTDAQNIIVAGINIGFNPQVIFKVEAYLTRNQDSNIDNSNILISTLSIAF
jgi:hypothetical protein